MKSYREDVQVETTGHRDIHDITQQVSSVVERSGIHTGTVHVFNVGSTASIGTIEFDVKPRSRQIVVTVQGDQQAR